MRSHWMYGALLAGAVASPSSAQVSVYIGTPPPAVVYEGHLPGPGFVWMEGYWAPAGRHYKWVRGHWERPPFEGAYCITTTIAKAGKCTKDNDREDHHSHYWRDHDHGHGDHDDHGHEHHD